MVITIPSKAALATVTHKVKQATGAGPTSLHLVDVLAKVNPVLRSWGAYSGYGASKKMFFFWGITLVGE
jgi:hypothetical protein